MENKQLGETMMLEKNTFTIGDYFKVDGIHDPSVSWNGWRCPSFPIESVRIIEEWTQSLGDSVEIVQIEDGKVFNVYSNDGEMVGTHLVEREEVLPWSFEGVDYYDIGSHNWVWSTVKD